MTDERGEDEPFPDLPSDTDINNRVIARDRVNAWSETTNQVHADSKPFPEVSQISDSVARQGGRARSGLQSGSQHALVLRVGGVGVSEANQQTAELRAPTSSFFI